MRRLLLPLFLLPTLLIAQERQRPFLRGSLGYAGGQYNFENDNRSLDDYTDAGLLQARFEGTSNRGIGGGLRYEAMVTDDDLFVRNGASASEAFSGTLFAHFTYRAQEHRFAMPLRVGALLQGLNFEVQSTRVDTNYTSIGPYFEVEPEVVLVRRNWFRWSIYGQLGVGAGITAIDIDNDFRDYVSTTAFVGVEAGTRLRFGHAEIGIAYLGRYQSMDESDVESGQFVRGYDSDFNGLLLTFGVVF